jgi:hypothetical protein
MNSAVASQSATTSNTPCTFVPAQTCSNTNPSVALRIYYYGDTSACTFVWNVDWGDNQTSPNLTVTDPADGYRLLTDHTYATTGTYSINVTGQVTSGNCTATGFTVQFTLTKSPPDGKRYVRVWGVVACTQYWPLPLPGPKYEASRVRFQAANGEAHDATIWKGFAYYVNFYHVPRRGETVNVYVTCQLSDNPNWGTQFTLTRHSVTHLQNLNLLHP